MLDMLLSLGQAAKLTGKSKTTLTRAIQAGRLSATRRDDGSYQIDPAELCRVYDVRPATHGTVARDSLVVHHATPGETPYRDPETAARMAELETELRMLRELLVEVRESRDELRAERDDWRARAERLLTDQRPKGRPTSTSAPRPPVEAREAQSGESIETGMEAIRRRLENLRAKAGH
jgi:hypothetical protein